MASAGIEPGGAGRFMGGLGGGAGGAARGGLGKPGALGPPGRGPRIM